MSESRPRFVLLCDAESLQDAEGQASAGGVWRFLLQPMEDGDSLEVCEVEPEVSGERLELLSVVRGLEAIDQPSKVTLITSSRCVSRGLRQNLDSWRASGWRWERFGRLAPVKDADLWQRIDQALQFHQIQHRTWRLDPPKVRLAAPHWTSAKSKNVIKFPQTPVSI